MVEERKGSFQGDAVSPNRILASGVRIASLRIAALTGGTDAPRWVQLAFGVLGSAGQLGRLPILDLGDKPTARICLGQLLDSIGDMKS